MWTGWSRTSSVTNLPCFTVAGSGWADWETTLPAKYRDPTRPWTPPGRRRGSAILPEKAKTPPQSRPPELDFCHSWRSCDPAQVIEHEAPETGGDFCVRMGARRVAKNRSGPQAPTDEGEGVAERDGLLGIPGGGTGVSPVKVTAKMAVLLGVTAKMGVLRAAAACFRPLWVGQRPMSNCLMRWIPLSISTARGPSFVEGNGTHPSAEKWAWFKNGDRHLAGTRFLGRSRGLARR